MPPTCNYDDWEGCRAGRDSSETHEIHTDAVSKIEECEPVMILRRIRQLGRPRG